MNDIQTPALIGSVRTATTRARPDLGARPRTIRAELRRRRIDRAAPALARLDPGASRRAAVLRSGSTRVRGADPLVSALRRAGLDVVELDSDLAPADLHARLTAHGPLTVIVDAGTPGPDRARRLRDTFLHLERGGRYVVPGVSRSIVEGTGRHGATALSGLVQGLRDAPSPESVARREVGARETAEVSARVERIVSPTWRHGALVLVATGHHALPKIGEEHSRRYLGTRRGAGTTLNALEFAESRPYTSRALLRQSEPMRREAHPGVFRPPHLSFRDLRGAVCAPGQVLSHDGVLLPDTYRHLQGPRLVNPYAPNVTHWFADVPALRADAGRRRDVADLPGTYFYLDNAVRGHFGHAMTEQLARLWALDRARREAPEIRCLVGTTDGRGIRGWEAELFGAAGIPREDLVVIEGPVRVERLVTATPLLSMPHFVHPRIAETWRRVGDALVEQAPEREYPRRIFCTRLNRKRACRNAGEVERLFAEHGFEILLPERHSVAEQARLFREAEVIAGYAGSAMLSAIFATEPKHLITLTSTRYRPNNEYLIASVLGHRLDEVYGPPVEWTDDDRSRAVTPGGSGSAPFEIRAGHEGRFLGRVLDELPRPAVC